MNEVDKNLGKRDLLVTTAFGLFYTYGIHAVGINQILQESGIAKKTLYHHFDSKEALIAAVVAYRDQKFYDWLSVRVNLSKPGKAGIMAIFSALDDWINNRVDSMTDFHGCFFINACAEYSDPQSPVHKQSAEHKQRIRMLISKQVEMLMLAEETANFLIDSVCLLKEGAIVQAHVSGDLTAAEKAAKTAAKLIESVVKQ